MPHRFGPIIHDHAVEFRLWAPLQNNPAIIVDGGPAQPLRAHGAGWFSLMAEHAGPGSLYSFVLDDGLQVPDPASRYQPSGVHGPSEVVDLKRLKADAADWSGRSWEETVFYELHVGAFTPEGSFAAMSEKLNHLQNLGITAVQLMPLSSFAGRFGWGYDGVLPYAPHNAYGRPEDLMAFIERAHGCGIGVFLDVVYNHFGPEGNYQPLYARLFSDKHTTPWGPGINLDDRDAAIARDYLIENAIYWITDYGFDGLRLDAVHQLKDESAEHFLHELSRRVRDAAGDRLVHLVVENEDNDADLLARAEGGKVRYFNAQWNDDIHHALHIVGTGETFGYYADYRPATPAVAKALAEGFVFQGDDMPYRGSARGKPSAGLSPGAFVSFIQNHDQIGNRAQGDRVVAEQPLPVQQALAAVYLIAPQIPMLFMGEEWSAREPFPFFSDFSGELGEKVREGRRTELSRLPGFSGDDYLDPTAEATFDMAKLDWQKREQPPHAGMLGFYRKLLTIRQTHIVPLLQETTLTASYSLLERETIAVTWQAQGRQHLRLLAQLSDDGADIGPNQTLEDEILCCGTFADGRLGPWTVVWSIRR